MNFKKTILVLVLVAVLFSTAFAAGYRRPARRSTALFSKGDLLLTPELVFIQSSTNLGANAEYFIQRNITVGGDVLLWLEGSSGMILSPDVAYHFNVKVEKLDLFAGAGPAIALGFGHGGGSEFYFKPFGGARYFITPKIAAYFKMLAFIGSHSSLGGAFGATFRM